MQILNISQAVDQMIEGKKVRPFENEGFYYMDGGKVIFMGDGISTEEYLETFINTEKFSQFKSFH